MAHNFPQILSALLPSRKTSRWGMRLQATLLTHVFLVFLVHAPTTQTALQSPGLLKGNRHFQEAEDHKTILQRAKKPFTWNSAQCWGNGEWLWLGVCLALFAGTAPNTLGIPGERTSWQ